MTMIQGIFLGIIQGVAEFLPISSSGHLLMFRNIMGLGDVPVLFDVLLHVASLIVILVMYRKKIIDLLISLGHWIVRKTDNHDTHNMKVILIVLICTFFTGIIGIFIEGLNLSETPKVVFPLYVVTAFILWFTKNTRGDRELGELKIKDGIIMGIAQGIGVLPGISRSGITISTGLYRKMSRDTAAELSFIIVIPAILGALILDLKDGGALLSTISFSVLSVSFITTMIAGFLSLTLLVKLINSGKFYYFSFYLLPLGVLGYFFL